MSIFQMELSPGAEPSIFSQLQEKSAERTGHLEHQETGINIIISDTEAALWTVDTRDGAWGS